MVKRAIVQFSTWEREGQNAKASREDGKKEQKKREREEKR